jgi:SPP1 family predicted phage head-tail adaptor
MPKTFGAGQLRHAIKIQRKTVTRDGFGAEVPTWSDVSSSVRADVRPISGSETFNDPQMTSQEVKEFHIRYRTGVETKD